MPRFLPLYCHQRPGGETVKQFHDSYDSGDQLQRSDGVEIDASLCALLRLEFIALLKPGSSH